MTGKHDSHPKRLLPRNVLLLLTPRTYRAKAFIAAAERLNLEVVKAIDMQEELAEYWDYPLGLPYGRISQAVESIQEYAAKHPIGAIIAVDDSGTLLAAEASKVLGLPHNNPKAASAARDKHQMRLLLQRAAVPSPIFELHSFTADMLTEEFEELSETVRYPCVVKPTSLSGSRGVIRANDKDEFIKALRQLQGILMRLLPEDSSWPFLVEEYIPGVEVAYEGILDSGELKTLAIFDKPDPLVGPYFEETIYITPSRLSEDVQDAVKDVAAKASLALGLQHGPVHAELRINDDGVWLIELAGRSIGGHCSDVLTFTSSASLEELILRNAFGMEIASFYREDEASGVMMLPIPESGILKDVHGCAEAESVPLVEKVEITARINYSLRQLPEGDSYLGFIFAKGEKPEEVERALRIAQEKLSFTISPELTVL